MYDKNMILIVGQAKPSREDAIYTLHGEFYISLVVEKDSGLIVDMECNTILSVTREFAVSIVKGRNLKNDMAEIERDIRERYFALTQKPLIACIKDAYNRYMVITGPKQKKEKYAEA